MLCLTRKLNEEIKIEGVVTIKIIGFPRKGQVRLGIDAPKDIKVDRAEVYRRKQKEAQRKDTQ